MRPPKRPQSALRSPLNHVLGTEANVRVLRVMLASSIPIGVSEVARRAELQPSGVARVCIRLEDLGVIEAVGRGARNRQYRVARRFPFHGELASLFARERERATSVFNGLRESVRGVEGVRAAWVEGPVAGERDAPGDPILVALLADPAKVNDVRLAVWQRMLPLQSNHDVIIELRVTTEADLKTATEERLVDLQEVRPLLGPPPLELLRPVPPLDQVAAAVARGKRHEDIDRRAKEMFRIIADRIGRDPSIVEDAKRYIERRRESASPGERLELEEWHQILETMSIPRLRRFLVGDDARVTRLRQSSPFLGVLSDDERNELFERAAGDR